MQESLAAKFFGVPRRNTNCNRIDATDYGRHRTEHGLGLQTISDKVRDGRCPISYPDPGFTAADGLHHRYGLDYINFSRSGDVIHPLL